MVEEKKEMQKVYVLLNNPANKLLKPFAIAHFDASPRGGSRHLAKH